jgi:hypothetical protein
MLHSMLAGCLGFSHSIATWCLAILMCCVCCNIHNVLHAHASFMLSILMLAQSECRYMLAHHTHEQELLPTCTYHTQGATVASAFPVACLQLHICIGLHLAQTSSLAPTCCWVSRVGDSGCLAAPCLACSSHGRCQSSKTSCQRRMARPC